MRGEPSPATRRLTTADDLAAALDSLTWVDATVMQGAGLQPAQDTLAA